MEDQLGALGLVLNAIVLWTTEYIDAAVAQLRDEGHEFGDEDIARRSPLKHRSLNLLGRYSFTASVPTTGALPPLRDPGGRVAGAGVEGVPGEAGADEAVAAADAAGHAVSYPADGDHRLLRGPRRRRIRWPPTQNARPENPGRAPA